MVSQAPFFVLFQLTNEEQQEFQCLKLTMTQMLLKKKWDSGYLWGIALGDCGCKSVSFTAEASVEEFSGERCMLLLIIPN